MTMTLVEFFGDKIPDDGSPVDAHVTALSSTPLIRGYAGVVTFLRNVRDIPVGRPTIERAVKSGELAHYAIGNGFSFSVRDIDSWIDAQRVEAAR